MVERAQFVNYLADPALWRLGFRVGPLQLGSHVFATARNALLEGSVRYLEDEDPGTAAAIYDRADDTLHVYPYLDLQPDVVARSYAAHEAVHIWCDAMRLGVTPLVEECAGYLVQVAYACAVANRTDDALREAMRGDASVRGWLVVQRALEIVLAHGLHRRRGATVDEPGYQPLLEAIHADPLYHAIALDQPSSNDGIASRGGCCLRAPQR